MLCAPTAVSVRCSASRGLGAEVWATSRMATSSTARVDERVAVALLVQDVERRGDRVGIVRVDRQLERLAPVAQVGVAAQDACVEVAYRPLLEIRESTFQLGSGEVGRLDEEGRDVVAAEVGHREAERAQDARRARHEDASDPKLLGEAAGVQPARAAEGDERELARVDTALDADRPSARASSPPRRP